MDDDALRLFNVSASTSNTSRSIRGNCQSRSRNVNNIRNNHNPLVPLQTSGTNFANRRGGRARGFKSQDNNISGKNGRNEYPQRSNSTSHSRLEQQNYTSSTSKEKNSHTHRTYRMGFKILEELANADSSEMLLKISEKNDAFMEFIKSPINRPDVFALIIQILAKVSQSSFDSLKLKFMIEVCNSQFFIYFQNYLLNLPYDSRKELNKLYWNNQTEFWNNFIQFCECIMNISPSIALRTCRSLIEGTSKICLDGLCERHDFKLTDESASKLNQLRTNMTQTEPEVEVKQKGKRHFVDDDDLSEPPDSFRALSSVPTCEDLLEQRPFLRANIVDGAYRDVEHYLDVQFRLLREDCIGPLREGIRQYVQEPSRHKYDSIRIFRDVTFVEPYISQLKSGYMIQLNHSFLKRFKNINWAYNKRFIYGSLVLFTKDNCKSFIIGTILDREIKHLGQGKIPVALVDETIGMNICFNNERYTMIESEVYFEPYYHVLNALKDPTFPSHLAMSKYIVNVEPEPKLPGYIDPKTEYAVECDEGDSQAVFTVADSQTWPSDEQLGLNKSQYEAYKLALTHEFAVIQGPPGTGKTYVGVKVASALIKNITKQKCCLLLICYTNHALDQFLEAILPITNSIARIGGQSRNDVMKDYNISSLRHIYCNSHQRKKLFNSERDTLKNLNNKLKYAQDRLHSLNYEVLKFDCVRRYVEECDALASFYGSHNQDPLQCWLFENVTYNTQSLPIDNIESEDSDATENIPLHKKDDFLFDDLDEDEASPTIDIALEHISSSFSMKETILVIRNMQVKYTRSKDEDELRSLRKEMDILNCHLQLFKEMSAHRRRANDDVIFRKNNPSRMSTKERWLVYFSWANVIVKELISIMLPLQKSFEEASVAYEESRMMIDQEILKNKKVIGMTTTGAARLRKLLQSLSPPIVIIEEAAEVLEQHIITSLTKKCLHLILIGDHQQLRPSAAHMKLAKYYNIEVSLFERMIMNKIHSRRLEVQHRMRPEIASLISPHIYTDLHNHPSVNNFPDVRGITGNLLFLTHNHAEEKNDESSTKSNAKEGDLVLGLANYLVQQDYNPEDITILSAYSGQMFYMRKQRSRYAHLKNVKITVVDNYQGEESKIILLSLVRNNDSNKIGFLGTENRICVALSRARQGFYMFGNINILRKNSELWKKIAVTLEENGSLVTNLRLRCEHHPDQVTLISDAADFDKVPEGGCSLKCTFHLSCAHMCPMVCHGYDRGHKETKCISPCERVICELGHVCPLMCADNCEPCKKLVTKKLPCGHEMAVACHLKPTDGSIRCLTVIDIVLSNCGHEAKKLCYLDNKFIFCQVPCIYRVDKCGHKCQLSCHVTNDPNHENYLCHKPCAKPKEGCMANLVGDRGNHQCMKQCHEACDPCTVEIRKKRSNCKHYELVRCNKDVNEDPCKKKCARVLPCNHFCVKKCYEDCGDCHQKVTKVIPDCNHTVQMRCMDRPSSELCTQKCERILSCAHPCGGMCKDRCDATACTVRVQEKLPSPCGHAVQLPCNVFQWRSTDTHIEDVFLSHCQEPCMESLACGHTCQGTCSLCRQGRLHIPCKQMCHQTNLCGHECQEPCNQVCPPCMLQCEVKCPHSRCRKFCGETCVACQEPCMRSCVHGACSRRCGEECSRESCSAACPRVLSCGHPCRGLCGEPCPEICKICRPDQFPRGFIGEEYDDDAIFVQLQDCPHIMELEEMDAYMMSDKETIAIRTCPFCRKPIINTNRYKDLVSKTIATEINPIKERVYGTPGKIKLRKQQLLQKLEGFKEKCHLVHADIEVWRKVFSSLSKVIGNKKKKMSLLSLDMQFIHLDILEMISDTYKNYRLVEASNLKEKLLQNIDMICVYLYANKQKISQQQQKDIGNELQRLNSIVQLDKILSNSAYKTASKSSNLIKALDAAKYMILGWEVFKEERALESLQVLQNEVKMSNIISKQERSLIVKAIGLKAGHWYKCPNNHFYCIGECGGANQVGNCIECGATVGGTNHDLFNGNRHAPEMDGSRFAAWSNEYNNMANFNID